MTRGGCPTASTCAWVTSADDARWRVCSVCAIERVDPKIQAVVTLATEAADRARTLSERFSAPNRSNAAPRASGPQIGAER